MAWGRSEANQKLICCSEPGEWILGAHCRFLLYSVLCLSLELEALSLGSWRSQGDGGGAGWVREMLTVVNCAGAVRGGKRGATGGCRYYCACVFYEIE